MCVCVRVCVCLYQIVRKRLARKKLSKIVKLCKWFLKFTHSHKSATVCTYITYHIHKQPFASETIITGQYFICVRARVCGLYEFFVIRRYIDRRCDGGSNQKSWRKSEINPTHIQCQIEIVRFFFSRCLLFHYYLENTRINLHASPVLSNNSALAFRQT